MPKKLDTPLKANAQGWWNLTNESMRVSKVNWVDFRKLFKTTYQNCKMTCMRAQKFIDISQGIDFAKDYATRFNVVARFALGLASTK